MGPGGPRHECGRPVNDRVALAVTNGVGTKWCAYVFALPALVSLPSVVQSLPRPGPQPLISWIAQTFPRLVLLSVIMVGQRVWSYCSTIVCSASIPIGRR